MSRRLKYCMHTNLWRTEINMLDVSAWEWRRSSMEVVCTEEPSSSERGEGMVRGQQQGRSKWYDTQSMKGKDCRVLDTKRRNDLEVPGRTPAFPFDLTIIWVREELLLEKDVEEETWKYGIGKRKWKQPEVRSPEMWSYLKTRHGLLSLSRTCLKDSPFTLKDISVCKINTVTQ